MLQGEWAELTLSLPSGEFWKKKKKEVHSLFYPCAFRNLPLHWECEKIDSIGFSVIADRETKRFVLCSSKHTHHRTCSAVADCIVSEPTPHTWQPLPAPARPHAPVPGADAKEPSSGKRAAHSPTLHPVPQFLTTGAWRGAARCWSFSVAAVTMMIVRMRMTVRFVIRRGLSSRRQDQPQTQSDCFPWRSQHVYCQFFFSVLCVSFSVSWVLASANKNGCLFFFFKPQVMRVCTSYRTGWTNDAHHLQLVYVMLDCDWRRAAWDGHVIRVWEKHGSITDVNLIFPFRCLCSEWGRGGWENKKWLIKY